MADFNQGFDFPAMIQNLAMSADPTPMLQLAQMSNMPGIMNEFMPGLAGGVGMGGGANIPPDPNAQGAIPQKDPMEMTLAEIIYGDQQKKGAPTTELPKKPGAAPLTAAQAAALQPPKPAEPKFTGAVAPQGAGGTRAINFQPIGLPNVPTGAQYPSLAALLSGRR